MRNTTLLTVTAVGLLGMTLDVAGSDWMHWRGPTGNGTSPDATPPTEWSASKGIAWKKPIPGKGSGSPVIVGNRVFVVTAINTVGEEAAEAASSRAPQERAETRRRGEGGRPGRGGGRGGRGGRGGGEDEAPKTEHQFVVMCLDRSDGNTIWSKTVAEIVPHSGHHRDHGYASASPITDGKHVWAHFGSRGTYCLTVEGDLVWSRTDLGKMETRGGFGDGSSPVLEENSLIVPWDHEGSSYIASLNAKTGKTLWKTPREEGSSWTTPLIVENGEQKLVIQSGPGFARAYNFSDGKEVWHAAGQTERPVASPVASDGMVIVGSGFRGSFIGAYKLAGAKGDLTESASEVWTLEKGTPDIPSLLLSDGRLYFHSGKEGILSCHDAKTGKPHYSRERIEGMRGVYASPVAAAGHVYLTSRDGVTVVIKDSAKLEIVATNELGEPVDATPALVDKQIFIRGAKHLYCIE